MNEKLTKREALRLCMELWDWLSHHPSKYKSDWPGWAKFGGFTDTDGFDTFENGCPCCEYVAQKCEAHGTIYASSFDCGMCPLSALWGDDCTADDSPYDKWEHERNARRRKKFAKEITVAAEKALMRELSK